MRQDDLDVLEARDVLRIPLERDEPVVVDRAERVHELLDRQAALPDELGHGDTVLHAEIMDVDVADIRAEVRDRGLGVLFGKYRRRVHIPQRGETVVREAV